MAGEAPSKVVLAVLSVLNHALATQDSELLKSCFFPGQAFWRDQLALTYHIRTFASVDSIAASLLETRKLRGLAAGFELSGAAQFIPATPVLVCDRNLTSSTGSQPLVKGRDTDESILTPVPTRSNLSTATFLSVPLHLRPSVVAF